MATTDEILDAIRNVERRIDTRCDRIEDHVRSVADTLAAHVGEDRARFAALERKPAKTPTNGDSGDVRIAIPSGSVPRWLLAVLAALLGGGGLAAGWLGLDSTAAVQEGEP